MSNVCGPIIIIITIMIIMIITIMIIIIINGQFESHLWINLSSVCGSI